MPLQLDVSQISSDKRGQLHKYLSTITSHIEKCVVWFLQSSCFFFFFRCKEICSEACKIIEADTEQRCQFWMVELNSGGNVKLIQCDYSHPAFNSCSELVHSRFSVADVESLGINGLEVTEVTRVENRLLFNRYVSNQLNCLTTIPIRFNDKLKSILDKEPYSSMTSTQLYKKMVDYLFLVWQEGVC